MSFDYDEMAALGLELITEFGTEITFERSTPGGYDPGAGEVTDPTELTWPAKVVILPASQGVIQSFDTKFQDGTLIESNLRSMIVAASGLQYPPEPGDRVTIEGQSWAVLGGTPLNPTGAKPLTYRVAVRRN